MPVTHVVLIAWSPTVPAAHLERAREVARGLVTKIPGLSSVVEGPSVSAEGLEGPYDYGMVMTFADADARDAYLPHPAHQEFVALLADDAVSQVTVFDLS